ncbi:MAG: AraC family transcriptional regulator [Planctomycetota bacterium]
MSCSTEKRNVNILDVAMKCGLESSQYFATVFKKQVLHLHNIGC